MRIRLPIFMGLVAGLGCLSFGVSAQTLDEALAAAYANNPSLVAARAALRATDEQVPQALSNWRPTVRMAGDVGRSVVQSKHASAADHSQSRDPASLGLSVSQNLYRGGRTEAETKRAVNNVRAARAQLISSEQTVLQDAVVAYMNVVRDQAILELRINNEQVLSRQLEATRDRFEVGEVTRTDVHQAEARLSGATADRIQAEGNLEVSRAAYRNVVGESPQRTGGADSAGRFAARHSKARSNLAADGQSQCSVCPLLDERASLDNVDLVRGELLPTVSLSTARPTGRLDSAGEGTPRSTTFAGRRFRGFGAAVPVRRSVYSRLARGQAVGCRKPAPDRGCHGVGAIESATRAWETLQAARAAIQAIETQVRANEIAVGRRAAGSRGRFADRPRCSRR